MNQRPLLLLCLAGLISVVSHATQPVISLLPFTDSRNSYVAMQRAESLSELMQPELAASGEFSWVERADIQKALDEIQLAKRFNRGTSGEIQVGHFLGADLVVTGHFNYSGEKPIFQSEVIDLKRADVLVSTSTQFSDSDSDTQDKVDQLTTVLAESLKLAVQRQEQRRGQIVVAPLYFANELKANRLDFLADDLLADFDDANNTQSRIRFLQFPRATDAIGEAELIAGGFVEDETAGWADPADYYVWGSYRETGDSGLPFDQVPVEFELQVWDGGAHRETFSLAGKAGDLKGLRETILDKILHVADHATAPEKESAGLEVRRKIATGILEQAMAIHDFTVQLPEHDYELTEQWSGQRERRQELLSVAAFLLPFDKEIRNQELVENFRRDLMRISPYFQNTFWISWQKSEAWLAYVQRFGFDYEYESMWGNRGDNRLLYRSVLENYLSSAAVMAQITSARKGAMGSLRGRPEDIPPSTLSLWHEELCQEFLRRLEIVTKDAPVLPTVISRGLDGYRDPINYIENPEVRARVLTLCLPGFVAADLRIPERLITETFEEIGRPEEGLALLAKASDQSKQRDQAKLAAKPKPSSSPQDNSRPPPMTLPLAPEIPLKFSEISFAKLVHGKIKALHADEGDLWVSIDGQVAPKWEQELPLLRIEDGRTRLFKEAGSSPNVRSILQSDGKLWLGSASQGLVVLDQGEVDAVTVREGAPTMSIHAVCQAGKDIAVGGGDARFGALGLLNPSTGEWRQYALPGLKRDKGKDQVATQCVMNLAGNDRWIVAHCSLHGSLTQILVLDRKNLAWVDVVPTILSHCPELCWRSQGKYLRARSIVLKNEMLWIATNRGLAGVDLETSNCVTTHATTYSLEAMEAVDDELWLGGAPIDHKSKQTAALIRYHCPSRRFVSQANLPDPKTRITHIEQDGATLWLGVQNRILAIDLNSLDLAPAQ